MNQFCLLSFVLCFCFGNGWPFTQDTQKRLNSPLTNRFVAYDRRRSNFGYVVPYVDNKDPAKRSQWWEEPDIVTAISMTSARSSGLTNDDTVILTVATLYTLDLLWDVKTGEQTIITQGDQRKDGIIGYSSITLTKMVLDQTISLTMHVNFPAYSYILKFDTSKVLEPYKNENVNLQWSLFDGPHYPNRVINGNIYEFSLYTQTKLKTPSDYLIFFHTFIDPEDPENKIHLNTVQVEYDVGYMETKFTAHLEENKPGELLLVQHNNVNDFGINTVTRKFNITAFRYLYIPRSQPISSSELMVFYDVQDVQRFPSSIRYGSLICKVLGSPIPTIEISKDGQVIDALSFSSLNMSRTSLVSFDGKVVDDVSGRYKCKASNGNAEIEQEILVDGFNTN